MGKTLVERLHLFDGVNVLLKPIGVIVDNLSGLDITTLKRLYAVYITVCDDVEAELISRDFTYETCDEGVSHFASELNKALVDGFLAERFKADYVTFLNDDWRMNLRESREYTSGLADAVLGAIAWKAFFIANMIEALILSRDEYWYPYNMFSVYLLSESGYSLEKKRERIWQPKTS